MTDNKEKGFEASVPLMFHVQMLFLSLSVVII